jgi:iron complex outermembrane receptor protein
MIVAFGGGLARASVDGLDDYNIPSESADKALVEFARQSKSIKPSVLIPTEPLSQFKTNVLQGHFRADDALEILLRHTGLSGSIDAAGVLTITREAEGIMADAKAQAVGPESGQVAAGEGGVRPRHRLRAWFATVFGCCAAAGAFSPTWAQGESAQGGATQLEEIVVTAEKREEDLEKTSVAVTAITSDNLQALGVTSAMDLTQVVPNLTVSQYGNGANVAIRGIVSQNQTVAGDPAVAYSVDGVDLVRNHSALEGMYDIDRVEVLRGPQGTLYGRNATAGSIGVITNKPDLTQMSSSASVGFGNYAAFSGTGVFNMPISSTFGLRVAIDQERHAGYTDTTPNDRPFNDEDFLGARVHLLWKPSDNFSALFTYDVSHSGGAGQGGNSSGAPLGLYAASIGATPYRYPTMPGPTSLEEPVESGTLTLNWSLPLFDITYVGNDRADDFLQQASQSIYGPLSSYCKDTSSLNCFHPLINSSNDRQISHELRFSKNTDQLKWVLGLYYLREQDHYTQGYEPNNSGNGTQWRLIDTPDYIEGSKAAFGQATWSLTDRFRLVGGLRYTEDSKELAMFTFIGPVGSIHNLQCVGCNQTGFSNGDSTWTKLTWRGGAEFDVSANSLLFTSVATGYKAGGFNNAVAPFNYPYGPENLTNYELGWKNQLFDNRMQINVDAYWMDYRDYQASAGVVLPNGQQSLFTVNAGKARIEGIEFESMFLLTPYDRLGVNGTLLDAKFTQFYLVNGDGYSPGASFRPYDLSGNELPYAPHVTARLSYEHTFPLGDAGSLVARVDSGYTSHQWMDYHNFTVVAQDAYTRTGLSLTWERSKHFSTQLYVRNLEDKAVIAGAQADQLAPNRDFNDFGKEALYMPPRTFGIKFNASM